MLASYVIVVLINFICLFKKKQNKIIIGISCLFFICITGLNTLNSDYPAYEYYYYSASYRFNVEYAYDVLVQVSRFIGLDYNGFLCIFHGITLFISYICVKQLDANFHLFLATYLTTALFINCDEIRQTMAYFLYALALLFVAKKKQRNAYLLLFLAVLFQKSSILMLLLPMFTIIKNRKTFLKLYATIIVLLCIIIFLNGNEIPGLKTFASYFISSDKLTYFDTKTRYGFLVFYIADLLNLLVIGHTKNVIYKYSWNQDSVQVRFVNAAHLGILYTSFALPLCMVNSEFLRYFRFSVIPVIISISCAFSCIDEYSIFLKTNERKKLLLIMIIYILGYSLTMQHYGNVDMILHNNLLFL